MSFLGWYFNVDDIGREQQVLCPFPHKTRDNVEYYEAHPSASVNTEKKVFHCKSCNRGFNDAQFIRELFGCRISEAYKIIPAFEGNENVTAWEGIKALHEGKHLDLCAHYNISAEVAEELGIISYDGTQLIFPVFLFGKVVDVRTYTPNGDVKVKSRFNATNGYIVPYDLWRQTPKDRWTMICAGEKDMSVARTLGFNAITITGGEQRLPIIVKEFEGRNVAIFYDNDDTGIIGANRLAELLVKQGAYVKVVTAFHEGMENKEDLSDYVVKYGHTRDDIIRCLESTETFVPEIGIHLKTMTLHTASLPQNINRLVHANIQVIAVADNTYVVPAEIIAEKTHLAEDSKANTMNVGETRTWYLEDATAQDILHLMDNDFKEKQINDNKRVLLNVPFKERCVQIRDYGKATIYKATVTDMFETARDSEALPMEYVVYSIGVRLESGKKYLGTFKLVPHPYKGQQLVMIMTNVVQASDTVSGFHVTPSVVQLLQQFQTICTRCGVAETVNTMVEKVKGLLGYNGNNQLIELIDLAYHTPLTFSLGRFKNQRAYLDTLIVGESRVGKSSTADTLRKTYGLGTFVSLAGNSATVPGLIGGSTKVGGSYQTKAGIIPQNHKGLVIFEEFGKCKNDVVTELTDIRSSNEVRITRVSGTLTLPAMVRMIALSNVRSSGKEIKPIASYPHGIAVVTELVGSAEDIARYDVMLVLSDRGNTTIDPFWQPEEPMSEEAYHARIRWVWSRREDQIIISQDVGHYIATTANELNAVYDTHIKVFGTEAWKKLTRLAIAIAGYVVSTDEHYQNIIVTKEHVDYAKSLFTRLYDNNTFRLREYVEHERKYSTIDQNGVDLLQTLYTESPGAVLHLEQEHKTNRAMLSAAAGMPQDRFNAYTNKLIQGMYIRVSGNDFIPTERFRLGMAQIERNVIVRRLGSE